MLTRQLALILLFLNFSCGQVQPTNEEIEKAFQEVNNKTLWKELEERVYSDQYYRGMMGGLDRDSKNFQKQKDSIWQLQLAVDYKNTKRMIDLTHRYGYLDPNRTGRPIRVWVLFHHAPKEYHQEIKALIEREYQAKRMDSIAYRMTLWHLNGRKGLPEGTGLQIIDNR
ncbi:hypothetical protein [Aquimarina rubra]|uniref:Uncharacterized protein n=1 Tax=Aquimarina rubra TaxID=1920033 RepID=A0ABW5LFX3_9FLAO